LLLTLEQSYQSIFSLLFLSHICPLHVHSIDMPLHLFKGTDSIIAERVRSLRTTTLYARKIFRADTTSWFVFTHIRVSRCVATSLYSIVAFLHSSSSKEVFYLDSNDSIVIVYQLPCRLFDV
jgi:hypothetical protein